MRAKDDEEETVGLASDSRLDRLPLSLRGVVGAMADAVAAAAPAPCLPVDDCLEDAAPAAATAGELPCAFCSSSRVVCLNLHWSPNLHDRLKNQLRHAVSGTGSQFGSCFLLHFPDSK